MRLVLSCTVDLRCQKGGPWAMSGPKPLVTRPAKSFVLLVTTRIGKEIVITIMCAALHTSATRAIDFTPLPQIIFQLKIVWQVQAVAGANLKRYVTQY
jgi:hypothetical protein